MLKEALSYPLEADHRLKTIGIGGLLYIIIGLIQLFVPRNNRIVMILSILALYTSGIILAGYSFRVFRSAAHEDESVPEFTDWRSLCIDGLKIAIVSIIYMITPMILLSFTIVGSGSTPIARVLYLLSFGLSIVFGFFLPVALTNLAVTDHLRGAFEFRTIINASLTRSYVLAVVIMIVLGTILRIIAMLLTVVIIGFFIQFYVHVFLTYLAGYGCGPHLFQAEEKQAAAD